MWGSGKMAAPREEAWGSAGVGVGGHAGWGTTAPDPSSARALAYCAAAPAHPQPAHSTFKKLEFFMSLGSFKTPKQRGGDV